MRGSYAADEFVASDAPVDVELSVSDVPDAPVPAPDPVEELLSDEVPDWSAPVVEPSLSVVAPELWEESPLWELSAWEGS